MGKPHLARLTPLLCAQHKGANNVVLELLQAWDLGVGRVWKVWGYMRKCGAGTARVLTTSCLNFSRLGTWVWDACEKCGG